MKTFCAIVLVSIVLVPWIEGTPLHFKKLSDEKSQQKLNPLKWGAFGGGQLNDERPPMGLNDERPPAGLNDERPPAGLNDEKPPMGLNDERPPPGRLSRWGRQQEELNLPKSEAFGGGQLNDESFRKTKAQLASLRKTLGED